MNEDKVGGLFIGLLIGAILTIIIFGIWAPKPKNNEIIWRTNKGIVCHIDELYPEINCEATLKALGPRLSIVEDK